MIPQVSFRCSLLRWPARLRNCASRDDFQPDRRSSASPFMLFLVSSCLVGLLGSCAHRQVGAQNVGALLIECNPADVEIFIDDRFRGTSSARGSRALMLPVGVRRIELRREGLLRTLRRGGGCPGDAQASSCDPEKGAFLTDGPASTVA